MKKILTASLAMFLFLSLGAQDIRYFNAADLNVIGKAIPTSKDFTRIDTAAYKFNDEVIEEYACHSTGLAVLFATDSPIIKAKWQTSEKNAEENFTAIAQKGLDLYIKKDGEWVFAGVGRPKMSKGPAYDQHEGTIVKSMAPGRKECLLYLPLFDSLDSLFIGVEEGSYVEPIENPFKYRIVVKGSSVTHGLAASRPGMSYAARFGRDNGFYTFNLGFSGNALLDMEIAHLMASVEDPGLFVLDYAPNAYAHLIDESGEAFFRVIRDAHPDVPVIFIEDVIFPHTIYDKAIREEVTKKNEAQKRLFDKLKKSGERKIYYIRAEGMIGDDGEATVDGIHFTDLGAMRYVDHVLPTIRKALKHN